MPYGDGKSNLECNTAKRVFKCWRCQDFSGSLGKLVRMYGTKVQYELYKNLASIYPAYEYNSDYDDVKEFAPVRLPDNVIYFKDMDVNNPEHFEAYNYIVNERKISRELILYWNLGFIITGYLSKRIFFESRNADNILNYYTTRYYGTDKNIKNKYLNSYTNKNSVIFGENLIDWDSTIYVCEGPFDMLSLPVGNSVALLGKVLSSALYMKLKEFKPSIMIILDPDALKNAIELYFQLKSIYVDCEERIRIVKIPKMKDVKDIDDLRKNYGMEEVIKVLHTARELTTDDLFEKKLDSDYGRRYNSNSKYTEWGQGSRRSLVR